HHHLGMNTWLGSDVKPLPPHTAGLREWTVVLASADDVGAVRARAAAAGLDVAERDGGFVVRDPWETAVVFTTG
ncbi:MAG: VOC family protein, partial [Solirubrobacteraceae bacterium]